FPWNPPNTNPDLFDAPMYRRGCVWGGCCSRRVRRVWRRRSPAPRCLRLLGACSSSKVSACRPGPRRDNVATPGGGGDLPGGGGRRRHDQGGLCWVREGW
ncbi:unnamed protein product, partial [Ectocarpus fasciculatus]